MVRQILLLLLISGSIEAFAQNAIKKFVMSNHTEVKTISPDSVNYADLEAIGNAIGGARVVMLGEQDHGDAPTFLAKTRLIKYLHEKKSFNVVAFESDFFALNEGWDRLEKQKLKIDTFLRENIFEIWTKCRQCDQLFYKYIPETYMNKMPLVVSGFDSQIHGRYSAQNFKKFLHNYLIGRKIPFTNNERYQRDLLAFMDSIKISKDVEKYNKFTTALTQIISELPEKDSITFEKILLKSLKSEAETGISILKKNDDNLELRDRQMAENLKWLVKYKFPDQKVIVWAHNVHIQKRTELVENYYRWRNMGDEFTADQQLMEQSYIIGFDSRTGTAGRVTRARNYPVTKPGTDSFETWIPSSLNYAFVDFKKFRLHNPAERSYFLMKGQAHFPSNGLWTEIFDGIFYIKEMYPCDLSN